MAQKKFSDLSKIAELEKTDILAIERADGTKQVSFKQLCNAIAVQQIEELVDELPEIEEDDTLSKIAGKINKWQKDALKKIEGLTGNVSGVDILDSKEEIEANTESGKAAGAQALKEMFDAINSNFGGCSFEQEGNDFYITGADAVRKKLGSFDIGSISVLSKSATLIFNSTSGSVEKTISVAPFLTLYKNLFPVITSVEIPFGSTSYFNMKHTFSFLYNSNTGVLTVKRGSNGNMTGNSKATVVVYYFLPE